MKNIAHFKIVILEDNDFYNKIISKHIENYISNFALSKGFTFEINAFTSYSDCVRNFASDTTIVITDFYLNDGFNALDLINYVRKSELSCQIIILSQIQNIATSITTLLEGACEFIQKDKGALQKSGHVVEEILSQKLKTNSGYSPYN